MSAWEDRHTDPSDKGQIPVITSAAIKALQSIPQLGMDGWHLVMHAAILTGFSAVIASHPSLATRLTACAVMANTCYASTVFAGNLRQMGYAMDATKSTLMCATLINQQDMVIRIYRLIQEGLQVCLFHANFLAPSDVHCPFVCCCAPHALPDMQKATINSAALLLWQGYRLSATYALPGCDAMSVLPAGATTMVSGPLSGLDRST